MTYDKSKVFIHPTADVQTDDVGEGTRIWQNVVVLPGARIGRNCNLCANVLVDAGARIGDNVTVKCCVQVGANMVVEDDVFIGPCVAFSDDLYPRSGNHAHKLTPCILRRGASLGSGCVLLPGIVIGEHAIVGAGSVVTKDVPPGATVVGNPARVIRTGTTSGTCG